MRRIIVFGTGKDWKKNKCCLGNDDVIVVFLDNNSKLESMNGIRVVAPTYVHEYQYDYIVIMSSKYEHEMKQQLHNLKVDMKCVYSWSEYVRDILKDTCVYYGTKRNEKTEVMIFSSRLDYTGAPMTTLYMARILTLHGHSVKICANGCDDRLLRELQKNNTELMITPAFPSYICSQLREMIGQAKIVIANTILMMPAVRSIQREKPILWWIHEAMDAYALLEDKEKSIDISQYLTNVKAVSEIALNNFNAVFHMEITDIMSYGIQDETVEKKKHLKLIFAIIGTVSARKAQDIFVEAVRLLTDQEREECEFWIIGQEGTNLFTRNLHARARGIQQIRFMGTLTREEIKEKYAMIDVVVCPSREDPLPIVMTEAMMLEKVCIASDMTGTAEYIMDGENGFVCRTEDALDLCDKMRCLIENRDKLDGIGAKGRKLYEDNWTLERFGERLENTLEETMENYQRRSAKGYEV